MFSERNMRTKRWRTSDDDICSLVSLLFILYSHFSLREESIRLWAGGVSTHNPQETLTHQQSIHQTPNSSCSLCSRCFYCFTSTFDSDSCFTVIIETCGSVLIHQRPLNSVVYYYQFFIFDTKYCTYVHIYLEYHRVCPLVGIGTTHPSPASECVPSPPTKRGGARSPTGEGVGES